MRSPRVLPMTAAAVLLVPLFTGCSGARLFSWPWQKPEIPTASERNPVHRIICMWEPSEGRGPEGLPARGFAGQVLFFPRTSSTPVKVDGDVRVYVFDELGPSGDPTKPLHQFDFLHSDEGDAWNRHLTVGTLGPSYNVFIPYTRRGRQQARCAVQIRYTPPGGLPLFSDMTTIVLPGPIESDAGRPVAQPQPLPQPVQTVSHFIDGPFGRQPASGSAPLTDASQPSGPTHTQVPTGTPAIGSVVMTPRGVTVMRGPPRRFDAAVEPASGFTGPDNLQPSAAAIPRESAPEADRLTRIEQMLEQLARQSPGAADPADRAFPAANGYESRYGSRGHGGAIPAAFELQPAPTSVAFGSEGHTGPSADWNSGRGWSHGAHTTPAESEPAQLDRAMPDRAARRLPPRPSWFDQQRQADDQPDGASATVRLPAHPLQSAGTHRW